MSKTMPYNFTTYEDGATRCHCGEWLRYFTEAGNIQRTDHCPHCGCEEYERDCGERRGWLVFVGKVGHGRIAHTSVTREAAEFIARDLRAVHGLSSALVRVREVGATVPPITYRKDPA